MSRSAAAEPSPLGGAASDGRPRTAEVRGTEGSAGVRLEREAAERVLQRAVELDDGDGAADHRISLGALLDAADELGIDRSEVHRAVHEEQLGMLGRRTRRSDRLLGPDRFAAVRVVDGAPERLRVLLDDWLRRGGVLRRTRELEAPDGGDTAIDYARRTDAVAGVQRAFRSAVGTERLAHVRRIRAVVTDLGDGRSALGLIVDASRSRSNAAAGAGAVALGGSLGSVAALHGAPVLLGVAASATAGVGVMALRRSWTAGVPEELDALLDAVAAGRRPGPAWFSRSG